MQIFVSYRRGLTTDITWRLYDRLCLHFGNDAVFMDVCSIPAGTDFHAHLYDAVAKSEVFLLVVGPDLVSKGNLRSENDFVRIEIEAALHHKLYIIPVLVQGASIPRKSQLPDALYPLLKRQALRIDSGIDFNNNVRRLIQGIERVIKQRNDRLKQLEEAAKEEARRLLERRRQALANQISLERQLK